MAISAAVLEAEHDHATDGSRPMPARPRATGEACAAEAHPTAVMAALRRLLEGQARCEAQLNRMEVSFIRGQHEPTATSHSAFSAIREEFNRIVSDPPSKDNPQSQGQGEDPASTQGIPPQLLAAPDAVLQALEEPTNAMEEEFNQVEAEQKNAYMERHHQRLLEEQEEARKALFHARNTAMGWAVDEPAFPIEHDSSAHINAHQAGGFKLWLNEQISDGHFDMAFGIIILFNAMLMLLQLQERGVQDGYKHGFSFSGVLDHLKAKEPEYHIDEKFYLGADIMFLVIFCIELIMRITIRYRTFFKHGWNYLDVLLVVLAFLDVFFSTANLTYFRVLRLVRLTRALRVARMMRSFAPLRILVATAMQSMLSLLWAILLIGLILLLASCAMGTLVLRTIEDDSVDFAVREELWQLFGTAGHAYYTFFRWTLTTSWTSDVELLILGVNGYFGFLVFPFIIVVNFALIRVVTALFIRDTFAAGREDTMTVLEETMKRDNSVIRQLTELFQSFDADSDGLITKAEFDTSMLDPRMQLCLKSLEVEPHEATSLFVLLDHGMGKLDIYELIAGAMDLRQEAKGKGVDLATLKYESQKTMLVVRSIEQKCGLMLKFMEYTMKHMHTVHELHDTVHDTVKAI